MDDDMVPITNIRRSPSWEQRRWEMAKELTIRLVMNGRTERYAVADAISITDQLIKEFKKKKR